MKHLENQELNIKQESNQEKPKNNYLTNLTKETSMGRTENDALTFTASGSTLLDFYAQAGAMRGNPEQALDLFKKALAENKQSAIRILFYLRDVRGGQGERTLFRMCLEYLGTDFEKIFKQIIKHVPEYGRWDDMFFDNQECTSILKEQLAQDLNSKTPSLLAKWLPTINASSKKTKAKARYLANKLGFGEMKYRKTIRHIRKTIKLVEEKMSAKQWNKIDYSKVPSQAARIYRNAFRKHDEERYNDFIDKAEKGEVKINAGTLYPYQIYNTVLQDYSKTLEALWNQLPDYTQGKNAIVVADVSGSMSGDPMAVSVSLALYFAERNKGQFQDYFLTFSQTPKLQKVQGTTLKDKMNSIQRADWDMNTNLQAIFDLLLSTAVNNETPKEELPETIYIISDMEFDEATTPDWNQKDETNFEVIKEKYKIAGYKMPNLVFWNVEARSGQNLPVQADERGVAMVSGLSPVIFKIAVEGKTPVEVMQDTVDSERYNTIIIEE